MIIRKDVIVTLKASPLNSRVVRSTSGYDKCAASTLNGSPNCAFGAPLQGAFHCRHLSAGPSDAAAIERRRFQRLSDAAAIKRRRFQRL